MNRLEKSDRRTLYARAVATHPSASERYFHLPRPGVNCRLKWIASGLPKSAGAFYRVLAVIAVVMLGLLSIIGSGGGGGGDTTEPTNGSGGGWVTITQPTSEPNYSTVCDSVFLSGEAFISPTWSGCCSGSAEILTGVTVTWVNDATGASDKAAQSVDICYFFGTPYLCNHRWFASIPLALADNRIKVTATDPSGISGQAVITVNKPTLSYSISGRVTDQNGIGLPGGSVPPINLTLTDVNRSTTVATRNDGTYGFACVAEGSYSLTPSSTISYLFVPPDRTVTVAGADVTGQDFTAEAYPLSGKVTWATTGFSYFGAQITLAGPNSSAWYFTAADGTYSFVVPNGTYTLTPSDPFFILQTFLPASRTVTVSGAGVTGQDFTAQ